MIIDWIAMTTLGMVRSLLDGVSGLLPNIAVPTIGGLVHGYTWVNSWLPLDEFFSLVEVSIGLVVAGAAFQGVLWALRKIPVFGTR